ncbi:hypothetical protein BV20DRAFT_198303 [Pilatotrama ljubarskyi]|nr:hypothetical protein BV20DRAFT_198303 [Pilatotrama ljubarskyi]
MSIWTCQALPVRTDSRRAAGTTARGYDGYDRVNRVCPRSTSTHSTGSPDRRRPNPPGPFSHPGIPGRRSTDSGLRYFGALSDMITRDGSSSEAENAARRASLQRSCVDSTLARTPVVMCVAAPIASSTPSSLFRRVTGTRLLLTHSLSRAKRRWQCAVSLCACQMQNYTNNHPAEPSAHAS